MLPHPGESAPPSHYHCHCEAEGRGNLLEESREPYEVPGDCTTGIPFGHHVASLLAMTRKIEPGPSIGSAPGHPGRGGPTGPTVAFVCSTQFVILSEQSESKDLRTCHMLRSHSVRRSFDFGLRPSLRMTGFQCSCAIPTKPPLFHVKQWRFFHSL